MSISEDITRQQDWDHFWSIEARKKNSSISWSKKRIMQILDKNMNKEMHVLDAGSGTGFFSQYFCDQGAHTVALDYSSEALAITKERTQGRVQTLQADMLAQKMEDVVEEKFDLIFSDGLFEHFPIKDQDVIVCNLKSVLAEGGILVTFVPNRWSPWELIRPFMMPGIKEDPFILKELIDLNLRNGLDVIESGGINVLPFSFSPDKLLGKFFGMLLYTVSHK